MCAKFEFYLRSRIFTHPTKSWFNKPTTTSDTSENKLVAEIVPVTKTVSATEIM